MLCIPVRYQGEVVAVLTRESAPSFGRQPGELERIYVDVFNRFARMIAAGDFPFDAENTESKEAPRVGDGVIVLDESGRVEYSSPNAVSTLHRLGIHGNAEGLRFSEVGLEENVVRTAFAIGVPVTEEIPRGLEVTVLMRCIPMLDNRTVTGAVVLLRDISELRTRDLLLLSKDATIREIHHRVKNNLQTISSLLRLQGRRLESPEAKAAIEESVRRIRSIALVHEILSREVGDDVPFVEIVRPLVTMIEEAIASPDRPIRVTVEGDGGIVPAGVATPLAVVLNELFQNAIDALTGVESPRILVSTSLGTGGVLLTVRDNGTGIAEGVMGRIFEPYVTTKPKGTGLGLAIVKKIVDEHHGRILVENVKPHGATVSIVLPSKAAA